MDDIILKCNDLNKNYGSKKALNNINISIKKGRITGLLGPNGSGKTTLIKIICGLLTPDSGEVTAGENKIGTETKKIISYLPDCVTLPSFMKIKELIRFYIDFYDDFDAEKANKMLDNLNIDRNAVFRTFSKGNKEKIQLILTMSRNAEIYILDEPIGGVDPAARDYILNTIISGYGGSSSVIISTHLISDVEKVLDDVIFLRDGEIIMTDMVDNIRDKYSKSVDMFFREVFKC